MKQAYGLDPREAFPGPGQCDWCFGPLDQTGLCLARCRSWANENSRKEIMTMQTQTTTYKLTDSKGKTVYVSGASLEIHEGAWRPKPPGPELPPWLTLWLLDPQAMPMLSADIPSAGRMEFLDPPVQVTTIQADPPEPAPDDPGPECAWCGSDAIEIREYDFGVDHETGYHDQGSLFVCTNCGRSEERLKPEAAHDRVR